MEDILFRSYSAILPIILGYLIHLLKEQSKERKANSLGTMLLLRVQLIECHDKYMAKGSIPSYAFENFVEMYDAYHELGGNGMAERMHDDIKQLKIENRR